MKVRIIGAGPSGLYLAILLKKDDPGHDVIVLERNPPDATFGWGVVFSEETLGALRDADHASYLDITETFAHWDAIDIAYRGSLQRCRGHAFSAISRKRLLDILQRRCAELGVELRFGAEVEEPGSLADADLVVGADGVHSVVRRRFGEAFGSSVEPQGCRYIWYGTDLVLDAFRFIFADTEHGMIQVHAYPFDEHTSTFIVESPETVWRRAGLDQMSEQESMEFCANLFAADLDGHRLLSNKSAWLSFPRVRNHTWYHGNSVLIGDAAHTAHFTIGSGTKLAMEDSIALAQALALRGDDPSALVAALADYESDRQPVVARFQRAAAESADYFERVHRHDRLPSRQFAMNLLTRSGRIGHTNLAVRDPDFVRAADAEFAGLKGKLFGPPPALSPLRLGEVVTPNRIVISAHGPAELAEAAHRGAGLVLAGPAAVSPEGRTTPETAQLGDAWTESVAAVHTGGALAGIRLSHGGRRAATRPARSGVDLPLPPEVTWQLVAPSAIPYGPACQVPMAMTDDDLVRIRAAFTGAATDADAIGFDVLELDCAHGGLLAGFLSPLSNLREDNYGGDPQRRKRYPLEVLAAVRAAVPERVLAVRLSVTDWASRGMTIDEGIDVAKSMAENGADLVHVEAGQTVAASRPVYGRGFLTTFSDRVRSEAHVPTMVGGHLTTLDEVNTALASGRADLCIVDFPGEET